MTERRMEPVAALVAREKPSQPQRTPGKCFVCGCDIVLTRATCDRCRVLALAELQQQEAEQVKQDALERFRAGVKAARASIPERWAGIRPRDERLARVRPEDRQRAVRAVREARDVTIVGSSGSDKTTLACALLEFLITEGEKDPLGPDGQRVRSARYVRALDIGKASREHPLGEGPCPFIEELKRCSLLVIDNVGGEGSDRHYIDAVADVIEVRHMRERLVTIATTWCDIKITGDGTSASERYGNGIARILYEARNVEVIRLDQPGGSL